MSKSGRIQLMTDAFPGLYAAMRERKTLQNKSYLFRGYGRSGPEFYIPKNWFYCTRAKQNSRGLKPNESELCLQLSGVEQNSGLPGIFPRVWFVGRQTWVLSSNGS